jgi:hypothetical protein
MKRGNHALHKLQAYDNGIKTEQILFNDCYC